MHRSRRILIIARVAYKIITMSPRRENTLQIMCANTIRSRGMAILCGQVPPLLESRAVNRSRVRGGTKRDRRARPLARTHARTHARVSPFTPDSRRVALVTLASRWGQVIHHASSPSLQSLPIAAFSGCIRLQRALASTSRVEIYPPRARLPNRLRIESLSRGDSPNRIVRPAPSFFIPPRRIRFTPSSRIRAHVARYLYAYEVESFAGNVILLSKSV